MFKIRKTLKGLQTSFVYNLYIPPFEAKFSINCAVICVSKLGEFTTFYSNTFIRLATNSECTHSTQFASAI